MEDVPEDDKDERKFIPNSKPLQFQIHDQIFQEWDEICAKERAFERTVLMYGE